jgi:ferredoxin-NADP reductase
VLGHVVLCLAWAHAVAYALAFQSGHHALGAGHLMTRTYPGGTGVLVLIAFTALWSTAFVRSRRAGTLDNTYRLYAGLLVLIVIHAPGFLIWTALPMIALVFELLSRRSKRSRQALVHELTPLRAGVTRLVIERPAAFEFEAGNYVFVKLPNISKHIWHPFTLSSPPEQSDLTLHAQNQSEWTSALRAAAEARAKRSYKSSLLAHLDGPHGAPSAHVFHSRNVVLIGAGAGITPLASILASIVARTSQRVSRSTDCELQNVELFWLDRDPYAYEWFGAQVNELSRQAVQIQIGVHSCVTGGGTGSTSAALDIARQLQHRPVGMRTTTHAGHPDWRIVLTAIADQHAPEPVEVFFCGPPGLGRKLRDHCAHIGLRFHEEKF